MNETPISDWIGSVPGCLCTYITANHGGVHGAVTRTQEWGFVVILSNDEQGEIRVFTCISLPSIIHCRLYELGLRTQPHSPCITPRVTPLITLPRSQEMAHASHVHYNKCSLCITIELWLLCSINGERSRDRSCQRFNGEVDEDSF